MNNRISEHDIHTEDPFPWKRRPENIQCVVHNLFNCGNCTAPNVVNFRIMVFISTRCAYVFRVDSYV